MKTHLALIQQTSRVLHKPISESPSPVPNAMSTTIIDKFSELELEEMDRRSLVSTHSNWFILIENFVPIVDKKSMKVRFICRPLWKMVDAGSCYLALQLSQPARAMRS